VELLKHNCYIVKAKLIQNVVKSSGTVVENSTHNPKIEGSKPALALEERKWSKLGMCDPTLPIVIQSRDLDYFAIVSPPVLVAGLGNCNKFYFTSIIGI
jgi:hypothetical protein